MYLIYNPATKKGRIVSEFTGIQIQDGMRIISGRRDSKGEVAGTVEGGLITLSEKERLARNLENGLLSVPV